MIKNSSINQKTITAAFSTLREHQWTQRQTNAEQRIAKLHKLRASISAHEAEIKNALYHDLHRSAEAVDQGDIAACYQEIDDAIDNLATWMEPVEVETSPAFDNNRARVIYEAKGIVLLFGPWNFPFNLLFQPLTQIVSAGNCAIVKPNELAPHVSAISARIIREVFDSREVAVLEGDVDLANALLELPVDHIFLTGSPAVGKLVMTAAAKNLASVTLELGGKNPVIIDKDADTEEAAAKIAYTRGINSGQVCLCPETVYVHIDQKDAFLTAAKATFEAAFYIDGELNQDALGRIINERNLARIQNYIEDATSKGAELICGGQVCEQSLAVHPTILCDVPNDAVIQHEEVFGPILTIATYRDIKDVYGQIQNQPKPLALYIFSNNDAFIEDVLAHTSSGGVTVNNCIMHCAEQNLPFGGANNSGIGRYHGIHGFKELSNERSILYM